MEKLFENLLSNQTVADILVLGVAFILFFFFLRKELRHEIKAVKSELKANIDSATNKIDSVKSELKANIDFATNKIDSVKSELKAEIAPIKVALENHITDTNKKIEHLTNRTDSLSDRFDRLYEFLLKDKTSMGKDTLG